MSSVYTNTYKTVDGEDFEITLQDTMLGEVKFRSLAGRYATPDFPDAGIRESVIWVLSFAVQIKGIPVKPLGEKVTLDEFEKVYFKFMGLIDTNTYYDIVGDANVMLRATTNAVEKPDDALTEDEQADPN